MNAFTLRFQDLGLEKDFQEHRKNQNKRRISISYIVLTFAQYLGLLILYEQSEILLLNLITWIITPLITMFFSQCLLKNTRYFWFGFYIQRFEIYIYLMEFLMPRFAKTNLRQAFFLGILANSLNSKCDLGYSWSMSSVELLFSYIYYFIRINPKYDSLEISSIIMLLLVIIFMLCGCYFQEKNTRKTHLKQYKLSREKLFWRNFLESDFQQPGFVLKIKNPTLNKEKNIILKSLLKSKMSSTKSNITKKICTKYDYSLSYSNHFSKEKLAIFSTDDLSQFFKMCDLISTNTQTSQNIYKFDEIISEILNFVNSSSTGGYFTLKNNPQKLENIKQYSFSYYMQINGNKSLSFRKARLYIGIISGTKNSKTHQILVTLHSVEYDEELEKLRELDKAKDKILANVTHDLRSPLNGILNFVEQAMEIENKEERNKLLEYAKINSDLLLNLINDILDISQHKEGKLRMSISTFSLLKIVEEVLKLLEFKAESKNLKLLLSTNLSEDKICESDPKRLKQVLINLIGNSLKFTSKGWIRLVITQTNYKNVLKFEVVDTGCGIKKELINKLFNPFVTFCEGGNNAYGIGLGLSICQTIIQQLGPSEKMFVSSTYGKGTKIGFLFFTNHERSNSFLKNSINFSEKSVTISKDSSILVTQKNFNNNLSKGTPNFAPNFVKSSFSNKQPDSSNLPRRKNNNKGLTEHLGVLNVSYALNNTESRAENPELLVPQSKKNMAPKRKILSSKVIENWEIKKTTTIKHSELKFSDNSPKGQQLLSGANSSGILSRSAKLNCSDFFTTFSVLDCESLMSYEINYPSKSLENLCEKQLIEESEHSEVEKSEKLIINKDLEEFKKGENINKPTHFFKDNPETVSFFSSESENRELLHNPENNKETMNSLKNHEKPSLLSNVDFEKKKEAYPISKAIFFENKNAGFKKLEKIEEEEGNEERKNELKNSKPINSKPQKKKPKFKSFLNVMVVDDDPFNSMIICRFLEKVELPLLVEKASNGKEALELFKQHNKIIDSKKPFHVIFMDCQMPLMNGYEASKNIKECVKSGEYQNCVVIAITAYNIQDEEEKCFLAGMDAIMMKPISEYEFSQVINQFLVYEEEAQEN